MILVFGKNGQVAKELGKFENVVNIGSDACNMMQKGMCAKFIDEYKPQGVINAAAFTNVKLAEKNKNNAQLINACAPQEIAIICKKLQIPFLHISTDYIFDGKKKGPYLPNDIPNPLNVYGMSKLEGEKKIIGVNSQYLILRTSWVFSKNGLNFVSKILEQIDRGTSIINVVSDQIGGPTSAKSIANASYKIINIMINDKNIKGVYHFCGKHYVSWAEFAEEIVKLTKNETLINHVPSDLINDQLRRPSNSCLDCSSINIFNIKQPDWKDELKQIISK